MTEKSTLALAAIQAILRGHPDAEGVLCDIASLLCATLPADYCIPPEAVNFLTSMEGDA